MTSSPSTVVPLDSIRQGKFATVQTNIDSVRVVDWNIDRGTRLERIAAVLAREEPDLCLLQEVDLFTRRSGHLDVADELARRLKLNYVLVPGFQELGQGSEDQSAYQGLALLTRLPVRDVRVIHFSEQSGFWKPRSFLPNVPLMQRRVGGRIAIVAELEFAGQLLVVYNTHFESRSFGKIQSKQLDEILEDTRRYPAGTRIVLAGDFNTGYNGRSVSEKLRDQGWQSAFGDRLPRTHVLIGHLDWLLVRGSLQLASAAVLRNADGSDHFPIAATLSTRP